MQVAKFTQEQQARDVGEESKWARDENLCRRASQSVDP
jgi:hypothetical protein